MTTRSQPNTEQPKTAYKLFKETCKLDLKSSIDSIYNKIRGLSPYPTAWCTLQNGSEVLDLKIYRAKKEIVAHSSEIGELVADKKTLKVAVENGFLNLLEVQLPGKRKMDVQSLLNGFQLKKGAKLL